MADRAPLDEAQLFTKLISAIEDFAIFTLDPEGHVTTWNPGAARMKGWARDEIVGKHFSVLYPEEGNRRDEPMDHLRVAKRDHYRGEGLRVRKNGQTFLADVLIVPIVDGGELRGFCKFVQDVTERHRLLQERDLSRAAIARLTGEAEYRQRFAATLVHDLRSSLTSAAFAAELLDRAVEDDPVRARGLAAKIRGGLGRTQKMIDDLLDVSRLDAGAPLPMQMAPCDLRPIIEDLRDEYTTLRGTHFNITIDGPSDGVWNRHGLRRMLENLVSNAVKYGQAGGPITIRCLRRGEHVMLTVHNEGNAIAEADQATLFDAFQRTTAAERSGKPGWGLGLTLVRGIVEAHGGVIKVTSYPEEGTTFLVDLPVQGDVTKLDRGSNAQRP